jgi:hydroxybutyrate-dimer hydrolase
MRLSHLAVACLASTALVLSMAGATAAPEDDVASERADVGIVKTYYNGVDDDLLTAGLGKTGLGSAAAPAIANPTQPAVQELRRLAIYNNYRALIDPTPGGGYGTLYGPNVKADGTVTNDEGKIAGFEYIAYERAQDGSKRVTRMIQVPDNFNPLNACIVTAPSSGSRGVYGAIATAGEWGLKNGCAVAYTDKGTGTGAHDLQNNTVNLLRGERADAATAGDDANFIAPISEGQRAAFNAATPNRFAFKHAHSQRNPEKDWGQNVLRAVKLAFRVLNEQYARRGITFTKRNTIVIGSSVSNGGGASVRAVEQDEEGLIDGVAVGEPNVNPKPSSAFTIVQGNGAPLSAHSKPLLDYTTLVNVFQGCADLATANQTAGLNLAGSPGRCAELKAKGLLTQTAVADQAAEAQAIINAYGILPDQNLVQPGYWFAYVSQSISMTYANTYGRFSVLDNLCGYSFAANGGVAGGPPVALAAANEAQIFGTSNGIPPTSGVALINNAAPGGPKEDRGSTPDQNLDGALCLRSLAIGKDAVTGAPLTGARKAQAQRMADGIGEVLATGRLRRVPAIFVTGRNDGVLQPNHTSRAYFGLNNVVQGSRSSLRYYEVTNAHHLDTFNQFPGYNDKYIPLHRYFIQAMDLMYAHLRQGRPLPPSQVVHTTPRGAGAPTITTANVPPIADNPPSTALITFSAGQVRIPD